LWIFYQEHNKATPPVNAACISAPPPLSNTQFDSVTFVALAALNKNKKINAVAA
jgi:hypothetical protein